LVVVVPRLLSRAEPRVAVRPGEPWTGEREAQGYGARVHLRGVRRVVRGASRAVDVRRDVPAGTAR